MRRDPIFKIAVLKRVEELSEQGAELVELALAQAGEQVLSVGEVLGRACLEQFPSSASEADERASAIGGIRPAVGEALALKPVDSQAHRARRQA
jgi:hypothetical protein